MFLQRYAVSLTTAADGSCTAYSDVIPYGRILQISYVKTDFDNGSTMTVTLETTGAAVWSESSVNASAVRLPRQATHGTTGSAALYAAGGTGVLEPLYVAGERIKVVVASGGNVKTGTLYFTVG